MTFRLTVCVVMFAVANAMTAQADQAASRDRAEISGRVIAPRTGALLGVDVIAESMAPGLVRRTRTDREGNYRLSNLAPGEYRLLFFYDGFITKIFEHVLVQGAISFDMVLGVQSTGEPTLWSWRAGTGLLAGRVADSVGRPWTGAWVTLTGQPVPASFGLLDGKWPPMVTDINGRFAVEPPLPIGTYRLRVTAAGFDVADVSVEVTEKRQTETHVTLRVRAPRPPSPSATAQASSALLVETTDGAWVMEPLSSEGSVLTAFLADVDAHQLDHSFGILSDESFRGALTRRERGWRWQFSELPGGVATVSLTATDNPNQSVVFRVTDRLTPFGPAFSPHARPILAVSRVR